MQTIFNVIDYGAYGNGKSDDTDAIMRAIGAASQAGTDGGIVYFPRGHYKVTDEIWVIKGLISLRGDGRGLSSIEFYGKTGIRIEGGWYNTISDLSLLAYADLDAIVRLKNCDGATVEDTYISSRSWKANHGILIEGAGNYKNRIYTVDIDGNGKMQNGISIGNANGFSQGIYAHNVECAGMANAGIWIENAGGVNLTDCEVLDSAAGLVLYPSAGMQIKGMQIENCLFDTCDKYGMAILDNGGRVDSFQAANCWASSTKKGPGVMIGCKGKGFLFTGCQAANNGGHGWVVQSGSDGKTLPTGISLSNCAAWGNSQMAPNTYAGFLFDAGATDFVLSGGYSGNYSPFGFNNQRYGVALGGNNDRFAIVNVLAAGNVAGGCNEPNSTATNKTIQVIA